MREVWGWEEGAVLVEEVGTEEEGGGADVEEAGAEDAGTPLDAGGWVQ